MFKLKKKSFWLDFKITNAKYCMKILMKNKLKKPYTTLYLPCTHCTMYIHVG